MEYNNKNIIDSENFNAQTLHDTYFTRNLAQGQVLKVPYF